MHIFISQLKVRHKNQLYHVAMIFTDHYSNIRYVHLQKSITSEYIVQPKIYLEAYIQKLGVNIRHYYTNNGIFQDNEFIQEVRDKRHTISFSGVNNHFKNGKTQKRIRYLK